MNDSMWMASFWLFLAWGAFTGFAFYCRRQELSTIGYRPVAEGKVVDIRTEPAGGDRSRGEFHDLHYAVIEFFADGKLYSVKSPESEFPSIYYKGQKLNILYHKEDPEDYEILKPGRWSMGAKAANVVSFLFLIGGLICFFLAARG